MSWDVKDNVERRDWLKGNGKNPEALHIAVTNTDGGGGNQTTTITFSAVGTSTKTANQLKASIKRLHIFGTNGAYIASVEDSNVVSYAGGTQAIVAVVELEDDGYVIAGYSAGF